MDPTPLALDTLQEAGASGAALDALLAYTASPFDADRLDVSRLPLPDEAHLEAWEEYCRDARRDGVWAALSRRLVQLRFPVEPGISQRESYRLATRRGLWPPPEAGGLAVEEPDGLDLALHPTLAGRIPVLTCRARADFAAFVRACSCRNEPEAIPPSMGACIVSGLNNWDRVARERRRLEAERGAPFDEAGWAAAFRAIAADKARYQDRLVVLSREPYSGVSAGALAMTDAEWRARSVTIRREHECTHYVTLRVFGSMRNNLLDEFIADFAGLSAAFGRYDAGLALRCLGLEDFPAYREGGRFQNYLQEPPVPPAAVPILQGLAVRAARGLERVTRTVDLALPASRMRVLVALAGTTLLELASGPGVERFAGRLSAVPELPGAGPGPLDGGPSIG